eukprot:13629781-Alexandrium_andersonii.AAC.1
MAGTQLIDSEWGRLEALIPDRMSARTPEGRARMTAYIRAAQWFRLTGKSDRWPAFCAAAQAYMAANEGADQCLEDNDD